MLTIRDRIELFRAELDMLQGRAQNLMGGVSGRHRMVGRGQMLVRRGQARQTFVRARSGLNEFTHDVRHNPRAYTPSFGLLVVGVVVVSVALFMPEVLSSLWNRASRLINGIPYSEYRARFSGSSGTPLTEPTAPKSYDPAI